MKFLMQVGDQLDLNAEYDGGGVDGVDYSVPASCAAVISVDATGIVEALALGEGVVELRDGATLVGVVTFDVLSQAEFEAKAAIRDGSKTLVIVGDEVAPPPPPPPPPSIVKISPTANRQQDYNIPYINGSTTSGWVVAPGYYHFASNRGPVTATMAGTGYDAASPATPGAGRFDYLYDGRDNTFWYNEAGLAEVGYLSQGAATVLKEVRLKSTDQNLTSRPTQIHVYGSNQDPVTVAEPGNPVYTYGVYTGWTFIGLRYVTWGNVVSESRTCDFSDNTTAFKHYKIRFYDPSETYMALAGLELWGIT